ncbi:MAG: GtrA family protein [Actinomycetes bacterium]
MADTALAAPAAPAVAKGSGRGHVVRFLLVGAGNTAVTLALFVVLQRWLSPTVAYTVVFALGLAWTTAMTASVVFGAALTWRTGAAFVGWYLLVYGVGVAVVNAAHLVWNPSPVATAVITIGLTAPLNFVGGRLLFQPVRG